MSTQFDDIVIRTLGFYQPFCTLMFYGKVETRWVRKNKKAPFPLGKYLLYTTKKPATYEQLMDWCDMDTMIDISARTGSDPTKQLNGYALGIADLMIRSFEMRKFDEQSCFVLYKGEQERENKKGEKHIYTQRLLHFDNVQRIEPFEFKLGKQGVGILPKEMYNQIKIATK